ncbi:hypothetical protein [Streptomyces sp. NPDC045369]|uniref:hypothetical protein n=1 Tax=Streptomyces sp. NPDC045369 TaxID=3155732 RepID=UPI0033C3E35C
MRIELTRADLSALDKAGRACKGDMRVTAGPDGVMVEGMQQQVYEAIPDRASTLKYDRAIWDLCRDLLVKLDRSEPAIPEHVAVDPSLLARFGKIKTPKETSPLLDMAITSANEPILIRCGPDFRGALMPVDRAVARGAKTRGGDFLW